MRQAIDVKPDIVFAGREIGRFEAQSGNIRTKAAGNRNEKPQTEIVLAAVKQEPQVHGMRIAPISCFVRQADDGSGHFDVFKSAALRRIDQNRARFLRRAVPAFSRDFDVQVVQAHIIGANGHYRAFERPNRCPLAFQRQRTIDDERAGIFAG